MSKESRIRQAINEGETLEITYIKFNGEHSERTISDIEPSEEWGAGYIHAFCHLRNEYRTFKIARIQSINGVSYESNTYSTQSNGYSPRSATMGRRTTLSSSSYTPSSSSNYSSGSYSSSSYSSSNNPSSSGGCYIATMAYGDYDHPQVMVLRSYRDNVLMKSLLGRTFVRFYYATSPHLVKILSGHKRINAAIRSLLDKFVEHIKKQKM